MQVRIWGSTGSIASPGPDHVRFGGNTSCLDVTTDDGQRLLLDGGTGIREAGYTVDGDGPVHVVFTHLHADHVFGMGFFVPLFQRGRPVHLWGPPGPDRSFREQLSAFFAHPLFPVTLDMVSCDLTVSDLPGGTFGVGDIEVTTGTVSHPGPTVAVRVEADDAVMVYVPDHEPGIEHVEGHDDDATRALCSGADLLVHDAMYLDRDYARSTGFGHCSVSLFAEFIESLDGLGVVVPFHQDPSYTDDVRDQLMADAVDRLSGHRLVAPLEGSIHQV